MLILFFSSNGVICHQYVPEGQTVKTTFYVQVLDRLCKCIAPVRPEMWRDWKFFLLHNNVRPHTAAIIQQFLAKKGMAQLSHPPYSPDLRPLPEYFDFPKLKLELKGDHNASIEDIQKSVTAKLKAVPISDFMRAMKRLELWNGSKIAPTNVFECQETISNKYYLLELFAFFFTRFATLSQNLRDTPCRTKIGKNINLSCQNFVFNHCATELSGFLRNRRNIWNFPLNWCSKFVTGSGMLLGATMIF